MQVLQYEFVIKNKKKKIARLLFKTPFYDGVFRGMLDDIILLSHYIIMFSRV